MRDYSKRDLEIVAALIGFLLAALILLSGCTTLQPQPEPDTSIEWVGNVLFGVAMPSGRFNYSPSLPYYNIGFRDDGVVVWSAVSDETKKNFNEMRYKALSSQQDN